MIAGGVHPPELVVQGEGQPSDRHVMTEVVREHEGQLGGTEAAIAGIEEEVDVVVEVEGFPTQRRQEDGDRRDGGECGQGDCAGSRAGSAVLVRDGADSSTGRPETFDPFIAGDSRFWLSYN